MIKSALQSSLTNDVKYRSMSAGAVPSSEYLIETVEVATTSVATIEFNNLAQYSGVYRHLQIISAAQNINSGVDITEFGIRFNGDSGSNYSHHVLYGTPNTAVSSAGSASQNSGFIGVVSKSSMTNVFAGNFIDILDPFNGSKNTTVRNLGGFSNTSTAFRSFISLHSAAWLNASSVSSIQLFCRNSTNWSAGSRFSLYGVN